MEWPLIGSTSGVIERRNKEYKVYIDLYIVDGLSVWSGYFVDYDKNILSGHTIFELYENAREMIDEDKLDG